MLVGGAQGPGPGSRELELLPRLLILMRLNGNIRCVGWGGVAAGSRKEEEGSEEGGGGAEPRRAAPRRAAPRWRGGWGPPRGRPPCWGARGVSPPQPRPPFPPSSARPLGPPPAPLPLRPPFSVALPRRGCSGFGRLAGLAWQRFRGGRPDGLPDHPRARLQTWGSRDSIRAVR